MECGMTFAAALKMFRYSDRPSTLLCVDFRADGPVPEDFDGWRLVGLVPDHDGSGWGIAIFDRGPDARPAA
jgi:hypothetical protein